MGIVDSGFGRAFGQGLQTGTQWAHLAQQREQQRALEEYRAQEVELQRQRLEQQTELQRQRLEQQQAAQARADADSQAVHDYAMQEFARYNPPRYEGYPTTPNGQRAAGPPVDPASMQPSAEYQQRYDTFAALPPNLQASLVRDMRRRDDAQRAADIVRETKQREQDNKIRYIAGLVARGQITQTAADRLLAKFNLGSVVSDAMAKEMFPDDQDGGMSPDEVYGKFVEAGYGPAQAMRAAFEYRMTGKIPTSAFSGLGQDDGSEVKAGGYDIDAQKARLAQFKSMLAEFTNPKDAMPLSEEELQDRQRKIAMLQQAIYQTQQNIAGMYRHQADLVRQGSQYTPPAIDSDPGPSVTGEEQDNAPHNANVQRLQDNTTIPETDGGQEGPLQPGVVQVGDADYDPSAQQLGMVLIRRADGAKQMFPMPQTDRDVLAMAMQSMGVQPGSIVTDKRVKDRIIEISLQILEARK